MHEAYYRFCWNLTVFLDRNFKSVVCSKKFECSAALLDLDRYLWDLYIVPEPALNSIYMTRAHSVKKFLTSTCRRSNSVDSWSNVVGNTAIPWHLTWSNRIQKLSATFAADVKLERPQCGRLYSFGFSGGPLNPNWENSRPLCAPDILLCPTI